MAKTTVATIEETEADLTKDEQAVVDGLVDKFEKMKGPLRVAAFEALLATYCHECGDEQPEDPEDECPCVEASVSDEDDEDDEDDEGDEESDDEDDEEEDEDETN